MSCPAPFTAAPTSLIFAPTVEAAFLSFAPTREAASLTPAPALEAACDTLSLSLWTAVLVFTVTRSILSLILSFVPIRSPFLQAHVPYVASTWCNQRAAESSSGLSPFALPMSRVGATPSRRSTGYTDNCRRLCQAQATTPTCHSVHLVRSLVRGVVGATPKYDLLCAIDLRLVCARRCRRRRSHRHCRTGESASRRSSARHRHRNHRCATRQGRRRGAAVLPGEGGLPGCARGPARRQRRSHPRRIHRGSKAALDPDRGEDVS